MGDYDSFGLRKSMRICVSILNGGRNELELVRHLPKLELPLRRATGQLLSLRFRKDITR